MAMLEMHLGNVRGLIIRQRVSLLEALCCYEAPNIYDVYDRETGKWLFICSEMGNTCCTRYCCAPHQSLVLDVKLGPPGGHWDNKDVSFQNTALKDQPAEGGPTVMKIERDGCVCPKCCCAGRPCIGGFVCCSSGCCKQDAYVHAGDADIMGDENHWAINRTMEQKTGQMCIGWITQPFCGGWCTPTMNILEKMSPDGELEPAIKVEGPACFGGVFSLCCENKLLVSQMKLEELNSSIKSGDIGHIIKRKPSSLDGAAAMAFTDQGDIFTLDFEMDISPAKKALVLATVFTADYMLYEKDGDCCKSDGQGGCITTLFNCYCCGAVCPCQIHCRPNNGSN